MPKPMPFPQGGFPVQRVSGKGVYGARPTAVTWGWAAVISVTIGGFAIAKSNNYWARRKEYNDLFGDDDPEANPGPPLMPIPTQK